MSRTSKQPQARGRSATQHAACQSFPFLAKALFSLLGSRLRIKGLLLIIHPKVLNVSLRKLLRDPNPPGFWDGTWHGSCRGACMLGLDGGPLAEEPGGGGSPPVHGHWGLPAPNLPFLSADASSSTVHAPLLVSLQNFTNALKALSSGCTSTAPAG